MRDRKRGRGRKRKAFLTPVHTAHYVHLLKPQAFSDGDPFYSSTMALPKKDPWWRKLEAKLEEAIADKWDKRPKKLRDWPIKDGDEFEAHDDFEGCYYINPKSYEPPQIVDRELDEITDRTEIYSGMRCRMSVRVSAWEHKTGKGVSIWLDNVQKTGDGEPISGKPRAIDDFEEYVTDDDEEDLLE